MNLEARHFNSRCPARKGAHKFSLTDSITVQSRTKTPDEVHLIKWLSKVTKDPFVQRADPSVVIMVGSHEDRWNRETGVSEVSVELGTGHPRHLDVGDQAGGFDKARGRKEISCRWEYLNGVAQRPHEPFHRLAKELVIFNNRDQCRFRHTASWQSARTRHTDSALASACELRNFAKKDRRRQSL